MAADPLTKAGIDCVHLSGILRKNRYGLHTGDGTVMEVRPGKRKITFEAGTDTKHKDDIDTFEEVQFDACPAGGGGK